MRRLLLALILFATAATAALAQFPPPGAYDCTANRQAFGTLLLTPDGDYQFTAPDGTVSEGQMGSSGTDVTALSGPLADDFHLAGTFTTDASGTVFAFTSDKGDVSCGPSA